MMKRFLFLLMVLTLASCQSRETNTRTTIPFVRSLIKEGVELPGLDRDASICIIGGETRAERLAGMFSLYDFRDNVNASNLSDGLPDFCGERIDVFVDNSLAEAYNNASIEKYRENVVKDVLLAFDTLTYLSPYDSVGRPGKSISKLVILSSSAATQCGMYDVDSLFSALKCNIPVFSPLSSMLDESFERTTGDIMTGVISEYGLSGSGIYSLAFQQKAHSCGRNASECVSFELGSVEQPLRSFIDGYVAAGYSKPLDVIIVDNFDVEIDSLMQELNDLTSVMNEESITYGKYISPKVIVVDAKTAVMSKCYDLLRMRNAFTHKITYPKIDTYTVLCSKVTDGKKILIKEADNR